MIALRDVIITVDRGVIADDATGPSITNSIVKNDKRIYRHLLNTAKARCTTNQREIRNLDVSRARKLHDKQVYECIYIRRTATIRALSTR